VRRYDQKSGRYETAFQSPDLTGGENFVIVSGEGYLISMVQLIEGVVVPKMTLFTRASERFLMVQEGFNGGGGKSADGEFVLQSVIGRSTPLGTMSHGQLILNGGFLTE
jgi:hypothetical protein